MDAALVAAPRPKGDVDALVRLAKDDMAAVDALIIARMQSDVPVIPLSIQSHGGPKQAYQLGRALVPLADQGFLTIASGYLTHNLRDYQRATLDGGRTPAYDREFADWLAERLAANDLPALLDYRQLAPGAVQAHPSEEHLLPLFVALGAGGENAQARRLHAGIDDYVLAMDAYAFSNPKGLLA